MGFEAFEASDILSYNVVQDHEGIPIKGYRELLGHRLNPPPQGT